MHEPLQIGLLLPTRGAMLSKEAAAGAEGVLRLAERAEAAGCDFRVGRRQPHGQAQAGPVDHPE